MKVIKIGTVTVLQETTKDPISLIGRRAGICWGADISNEEKNYKRGLDCLENLHGRTFEFPDVHLLIDKYSARVIREYYTHIGCLPTRLQESTRYVNYENFNYITPHTIGKNPKALEIYQETMQVISRNCKALEELGIPREDSAMQLPLGMATRIVDKRNMRNLIDMSRRRMCSRAYWEFRELFDDILNALKEYSTEWEYIVNTQMKPICETYGYCPEKHGCGKKPKRKETNND